MNKYITIGLVLAFMGMATTIVIQYRIVQQERTKQVAIKNPARAEARVVERIVIKTVDKKGDPVVQIKEIIRSVVVQKPVIPAAKEQHNLYYIGVSVCARIGEFSTPSIYEVGAGINVSEIFSVGVVFQRSEDENYIGVGTRINF